MFPRRAPLALLLVAVCLPAPAAGPAPASAEADAALARTAQGLFKDLRAETLPNGLRVYLMPVKGSPVVTAMVAYRVGSADEVPGQTGLSHYLEHLMFKGTDKLVPGDIDRATQRNGGHNNAYTSEDMTVYHFDFAADRWASALDIEADRMRNLRIDERHEFQQEKGAVVAELAGNEDQPWDLEYKAILPVLFPKDSPYGHPVIGEREHVHAATAEIIKRHYDKWYHPNNASLVVVGGFDADEAMARIRKAFGPIPAADLPARIAAVKEPAREVPVRKEIASKFDVPRLIVGFNTVPFNDPADSVLDLIQDILTGGKTGRLYRKMVEDERIASAVDSGNNAGRYPGWFNLNVELLKGKDRGRAEELVFAELERLAAEPVSAAELKRARKKILAAFLFSREGVHGLANTIARTATLPGGENVGQYYKEYLAKVEAVTPEAIRRVAKDYLARNRAAVVWSLPKAAGEKGGRLPGLRPGALARRGRAAADGGGTRAFSLADAKRTVLPNGLTLITLEDRRLPIVVAGVSVRDVSLREPAAQDGVAHLVGGLLEEGTATHTGKQIATLIEDTGGSLGFSSSGGSLKVLTPDADLGLGLLFECLTGPTFPRAEFDRVKEQQLSAIDESETQPHSRATRLFHATVYGNHPYGRPALGTKATVAPLTPADCRAFHAATFVPNESIAVVVGDFDTAEMVKRLTALTAGWKRGDAPPPMPPAPPVPARMTQTIVTDPAAAQVHVYIGELGIVRKDPDYYKLLVMDNVLGTGPGFTDRLSATLRDRQGLAYTVRATIANSAGNQPGTFTGYIGTYPDKFLWVRDGFLKEVERIRAEPPTAAEVDDAKKYLLGSLPFKFTTLSEVAGQLAEAERYGLGFDFLDAYRREVGNATPADVQAVARKHLDPQRLAIVAVGPIDAEGKPLPKP